jgi:hypothetical protein
MNRHSPEFHAIIAQLQAGTTTRQRVSQEHGLSINTLNAWLRRSNVGESTRIKDRPLVGAAAEKHRAMSPDDAALLDRLTAEVLDGTYRSALAAHTTHPHISLSTLTKRVFAAKRAAGLPTRTRVAR